MPSKGMSTRLRILQQVSPLFNRQGFRSTSMSELVAVTGLQKGGLYNHFSSKERLEAEALDYMLRQVAAHLETYASKAASGLDAVRKIVEGFESYVRRPIFPGGCAMANAGVEFSYKGGPLAERAQESMQRLRQSLENHFARGLADGSIRVAVQPSEAATLLIAQLEGGWLVERIDPSSNGFSIVLANIGTWLQALGGNS